MMRKKLLGNTKKGFTLIELLVVIAIIGLLSSIILAALTQARQKAQIAVLQESFHQFGVAMELYKTDHGNYPVAVMNSTHAAIAGYEVEETGNGALSIDSPGNLHSGLQPYGIVPTFATVEAGATFDTVYETKVDSVATFTGTLNHCGVTNYPDYFLLISSPNVSLNFAPLYKSDINGFYCLIPS